MLKFTAWVCAVGQHTAPRRERVSQCGDQACDRCLYAFYEVPWIATKSNVPHYIKARQRAHTGEQWVRMHVQFPGPLIKNTNVFGSSKNPPAPPPPRFAFVCCCCLSAPQHNISHSRAGRRVGKPSVAPAATQARCLATPLGSATVSGPPSGLSSTRLIWSGPSRLKGAQNLRGRGLQHYTALYMRQAQEMKTTAG